jgi:hypothetical protein
MSKDDLRAACNSNSFRIIVRGIYSPESTEFESDNKIGIASAARKVTIQRIITYHNKHTNINTNQPQTQFSFHRCSKPQTD